MRSRAREQASGPELDRRLRAGVKALRVSVLHAMLGMPSSRHFSVELSRSEQLADFCRARTVEGIKGLAKSTLDRDLKFFTPEQIRRMHQVLIEMVGEPDRATQLGLNQPLDTTVCLIDCTCLETNIHYPVDWVLLVDVARTLLKATKLIRQAGLLHRMPKEPDQLMCKMNQHCIGMTHTRRRKDGKRERKRVFRQMKHLLNLIAGHARRHRDLLEQNVSQTGYTQRQAAQIIERMDRMLEQLPLVIKQAHERIVGERMVADADKILSVYEPDTLTIVRGKAGREVEFGQTLMLSEAPSGVITDWQLHAMRAGPEWQQVQASLKRQNTFDLSDPIAAVVGDRGTASKRGTELLEQADIYDATCPRAPDMLCERIKEPRFRELQKRRASTEARIAILKQRQGGRLRSKGFTNRDRAVAWSVVSHNLWLIARLISQADPIACAA